MASPIPQPRLQQIASKVCQNTLQSVTTYDHDRTESWNNSIINEILQTLISESPTSTPTSPAYKYIVNSTIIQHLPPSSTSSYTSSGTSALSPSPSSADTTTGEKTAGGSSDTQQTGAGSQSISAAPNGDQGKGSKGRRGMHSAVGAYWNNQTDGHWNWKFEGGDQRGMDVVVTVIWVST